ncbi:MAG: hypothetical protein CM15mP74_19000 [Halieaceae bacterium]|nr:MAG: hypothetical protein CM15mP74_19000 [Halieaceae bacterium]
MSGCDQDPKAQAILRNLRQMAEDLGIELIAEGVETETEEETLLTLGIYSQQGFLRAKPMTQEEFIADHFFSKILRRYVMREGSTISSKPGAIHPSSKSISSLRPRHHVGEDRGV